MSHCGGCNMTPDLFKNFVQTLKIQTPPTQIIQKKSIQILTGESQFTNNGKFLKFIRK